MGGACPPTDYPSGWQGQVLPDGNYGFTVMFCLPGPAAPPRSVPEDERGVVEQGCAAAYACLQGRWVAYQLGCIHINVSQSCTALRFILTSLSLPLPGHPCVTAGVFSGRGLPTWYTERSGEGRRGRNREEQAAASEEREQSQHQIGVQQHSFIGHEARAHAQKRGGGAGGGTRITRERLAIRGSEAPCPTRRQAAE